MLPLKIFFASLLCRFLEAVIVDSYYMPTQPKQQVDTFVVKNANRGSVAHEKSNEIAYDDRYVKPLYKYGYSVFDPYTMDVKSQWEHRDGDTVRGAYNMLEADGSMRIVEYFSDKDTGFRAIVKKIPFYLDENRRPADPNYAKYTKSKNQEYDSYLYKDPLNKFTSHNSENRLTQNFVHKQKYHKQYNNNNNNNNNNNIKTSIPIRVYKRLTPVI
ncbi:hypothetical protein PGB90_002557 [Kerria lacca]